MNNMSKQGRKNLRFTFLLLYLVFIVSVTIILFPYIKLLFSEEGRAEIQALVASHKVSGIFIFIAIQTIQIIVAFIPGESVELIAGVLFGVFGGLLLCLIGILIGTVIVFFLVKALGYPLVQSFIGDKDLKHLNILKDSKKLETLVFILFLIPGTPKAVLTYIVPLTDISKKTFFVYCLLARIPSIITSTAVGASLGKGNWIMSIVIFAITGTIGLVGILYKDTIISRVQRAKNEKSDENK